MWGVNNGTYHKFQNDHNGCDTESLIISGGSGLNIGCVLRYIGRLLTLKFDYVMNSS